ncbi:restriction endonuclease subunit S [Aeromonas taiwanensis]|uniref:restriction endonuclease subunit S n=1 Tax=Aeromonas taiwanensis TaxID=633417 RepID=UPI00207C6980|nr:restriction endonuclease subunit S [Aeromonas taiwanensis]MCO4205362.1 restriction endonuclease subunit S [Aeromonas taiwanensis]
MSQVDKKNKLIPNDWASTKLDCVVNIVRGVTYKKDQASDFFVEGYLPVIRANNIQNDKLILSDFVYVDANIIKCTQKIKKNDIVVAMSSGSKSVVGKTAKAESDLDAAFGAFCGLLRPSSLIIPEVIGFYTRSAYYRNKVSELSAGANINNLKPAHFGELDFPLPPLAEQKEIADQLDTLLAQVEATQAHLARIPDIIKQYRQSVLAAAVSGKLTDEWRKSNNVALSSWIFDSAKNLCDKVQSGSTPKDNPFEKNGKIPFLKVYNIVNQRIDFDYKPQFVTSEVHSQKLKRSVALPDDVLMNIVGPPLGKVALLTNQYPEWNINQAITLFRTGNKKLLAKFLYFVLCEGCLVREVLHDVKGIVGQVNISLSQCREAVIPCPSLKEQTEIVRRVEQLFAYADSIEQQAKAAKERVDNLTQAILAKAFRGELTSDWRAANPDLISGDNSAAALLARIQAERVTASGKKGKCGTSKSRTTA